MVLKLYVVRSLCPSCDYIKQSMVEKLHVHNDQNYTTVMVHIGCIFLEGGLMGIKRH